MFLYVPLILHFKCHESSILNIKSHGTYKNAAVPTTEPTTVPTVHTAVPTTNGSGGRILRETPWRILLMPRRLVLRSLFFPNKQRLAYTRATSNLRTLAAVCKHARATSTTCTLTTCTHSHSYLRVLEGCQDHRKNARPTDPDPGRTTQRPKHTSKQTLSPDHKRNTLSLIREFAQFTQT